MVTTQRTYDVAVVHADDAAAVATSAARALRAHRLRVRPSPARQGDGPARARAWLRIVTGTAPVPVGGAGVTVLAPGVQGRPARWAAGPDPVRDLRSAWADPCAWAELAGLLSTAGRAAETAVAPVSTLDPPRLHRLTVASYDAIAEQFAERWVGHPPLRELEHFARRLRRGSRILDAGCGPGHHAAFLAGAGHDVLAVDASAAMLGQARRRATPTTRVALRQLDIADLRLPARSFDGIWCAATLLHVPREEAPAVIAGFHRLLRPGGLLALNFQVGRRSELVERGRDRRFFQYYPDASPVADLLRAAGFVLDSVLDGVSTRNTHGLDLLLRWSTLYARSGPARASSTRPSSAASTERHSSSSDSLHARK